MTEKIRITGTREQIWEHVAEKSLMAEGAVAMATKLIGERKEKREIWPEQAMALFYICQKHFAEKGSPKILEIGTALGFSAAVMAMACPQAKIVTLNPRESEVLAARRNLERLPNITVTNAKSWDYLEEHAFMPLLDMVFVDGDHKNVKLDRPWVKRLARGGLILYHDYSKPGSPRACPPVWDELNELKELLGRDFDVLVQDDTGVGMAGFYLTPGDELEL